MRAAWIALAVVATAGCGNGRATPRACLEIFDRIVELELREQGFRDPALLARKREQLRLAFAPDLERCNRRPLPSHALRCVRKAASTEEISHGCLRRTSWAGN
jgi:hypothetical protein